MRRACDSAANALRRAGLLALGGVFALVSVVFFTVAAWVATAEAFDRLTAALVVASVYLAIALLLVVMARRAPPPAPVEPAVEPEAARKPAPPLFEAFMTGLRAGKSLRRDGRPADQANARAREEK